MSVNEEITAKLLGWTKDRAEADPVRPVACGGGDYLQRVLIV